jgi:hypothetical protein
MGTKRPMASNSFHLIKPHNFHHPFASSYSTTDLSSTSCPMPSTNHPLVTPLILTNHTPPTSAPYQPPNLHVKATLHFPQTPANVKLKHFPLPLSWSLKLALIIPPQPNPISSTHFQPSPKVSCFTYGRQFTNRGLTRHQCSCQPSNSSNPNLCDHPNPIPSLIFTPFAWTWIWVSTLYVLRSFHLGLCCPHLSMHPHCSMKWCTSGISFSIK